ncbi:MAG: hypothetical protein KFF77_06750 [Bacteroidetes bacterium]|nr:hypothetical protein [Bacteroidota bacterium]
MLAFPGAATYYVDCNGQLFQSYLNMIIHILSALSGLIAFAVLFTANAQIIPADRRVDWTLAGVRDTSTAGFHIFDLAEAGFVGDGVTPNDHLLDSLLGMDRQPGAILHFPAGVFLFRRGIRLPSNHVLRGEGAGNTRLVFDLGGAGHAISVIGTQISAGAGVLADNAGFGTRELTLLGDPHFQTGDWIYLSQRDDDRVTSDWAISGTGQILQINQINESRIVLSSPLRHGFELERTPELSLFAMAHNVGIECLSVERRDDTAPEQTSAIFFRRARDCWVRGIESIRCTFAHVTAEFSSNIAIRSSYFHDAFEYGGGGRGYGVVLQFATGECRIEDNIFEHLRHSMLLQAGSNGNVFAYNYSTDPYWTGTLTPSNAAGDMVLHGNYPYANLFEQNICQNIVIDNSHGPNGPYNTFFRNRAELYGVVFSSNNSPAQNLIGNEITNTNLPYRLVNFSIQGRDHFLHANNDKGRIVPDGSADLPDTSYAYNDAPLFLRGASWPCIGVPYVMGSGSIPARDRFHSGDIFAFVCEGTGVSPVPQSAAVPKLVLFPNPAASMLTLSVPPALSGARYFLTDPSGRILCSGILDAPLVRFDVHGLPTGAYFLTLPLHDTYRIVVE